MEYCCESSGRLHDVSGKVKNSSSEDKSCRHTYAQAVKTYAAHKLVIYAAHIKVEMRLKLYR